MIMRIVAFLLCSAALLVQGGFASPFAPAPTQKPQLLANETRIPAPPKKYRPATDGSLTAKDTKLYREIFVIQAKGEMDKAERLMAKLEDKRLAGHVLYQRYMHPTAYVTKFKELASWMDLYADHPGADNIHRLALKKGSQKQVATLKAPAKRSKIPTRVEPTMVQKNPAYRHNASAATRTFEKDITQLIRANNRSGAVDLASTADTQGQVNPAAIDYFKAKIAESYLYRGDIQKAHTIARPAFDRSAAQVPLAGWVCGLISWYNQDYAQAAHYFEGAANSNYASGWMQSAGAYWASRAYTKKRDKKQAQIWLTRAQNHPRTFYGLLASQAAGNDVDFNWSKVKPTKDMREILADIPAAARAAALMEVGQKELAEQEMLYVNVRDLSARKAILALASDYDMPAVSIRLGSLLYIDDDQFYDSALYPDISGAPQGLYHIDPALISAIVRQESRFDPEAESRSGARGLMQIMPVTAKYVAQKNDIAYGGKKTLSSPITNLKLGQHYIDTLRAHPNVRDDLVSMLIAYNGGPGNLGKWKSLWSEVDDTLLFIELLPSAQTREYVERVLSNYWIYRLKQNRDLPVAQALANGQSATYKMATNDLTYKLAQQP